MSPAPTQSQDLKALLRSDGVAKLAIVFCATAWGISFFIMKDAISQMPVPFLLTVRFALAAALMFVLFRHRVFDRLDRRCMRVGLLLGIADWGAYALQTVGLAYTTPGKNAFLTGCYCVVVPFAAWAIGRGRPSRLAVLAAGLCVVGLGFVALDAGPEPNVGDVLTFACAVLFAFQMALTSKLSVGLDIWVLTSWEMLAMGAASAVWMVGTGGYPTPDILTPANVEVLVFLGVVCSAGCSCLLNYGLTVVDPSVGALLSSLESPIGVVSSVVFAGEVLTGRLVVGLALIAAAIVLSEMAPKIAERLGRVG